MGDIADNMIDEGIMEGDDINDGWGPCPPNCPYCGSQSTRMSQQDFYGRPFGQNRDMYVCKPCDARVGSHPDGTPLGSLANAELRALRVRCHGLIDPIWQNGRKTRKQVYRELEAMTGIRHIGQASIEECQRIIATLSL